MIIIKPKLNPLIRVITPELNTFALTEAIEAYIHSQAEPIFEAGTIVSALPVSGQSERRAQELSDYLNRLEELENDFEKISGYFLDCHNTEHHWVQAGDLIIDIGIRQFCNFPNLIEQLTPNVSHFDYLICDNRLDPIHQWYKAEIL